MTLNATHDPNRRSWVASAERDGADFPLQNLPFGVFRLDRGVRPRIGVAIGDCILDLNAAARAALVPAEMREVCREQTLNALMAAGPKMWSALRLAVSELLGDDTCAPANRPRVEACMVRQSAVAMLLPTRIGDYTDFYASIHHATNVGIMFRPDQPLPANYQWVPLAYHGRASSIVVSGTPIRRPAGQTKLPTDAVPRFGPTRQLDFELELGAFIGHGNALGDPIPIESAMDHIFGVVLLNDWSARDIQSWEYQPLGPFLAKNFATSISPWTVTIEALAPFRVPRQARSPGAPKPLAYLNDDNVVNGSALDIELAAEITTPASRAASQSPMILTRSNSSHLYWSFPQLVAHHTSNGCNLSPGDLLGTGTISGPTAAARASLLELSRRGAEPVQIAQGELRSFLEDGDEIVFRGAAVKPGARRIGFGECRGLIVPRGSR